LKQGVFLIFGHSVVVKVANAMGSAPVGFLHILKFAPLVISPVCC